MSLTEQNLLAGESSPYLLQHKDNPVHWRPWSAAALEEARALQKPILLSVGYAACHWCHVMAHESFEDQEVAAVMNRLFVNIKVDREERPEIDQIFMAALTATGEQGGWPMTMFLTPEAKPFWGGTYFPKSARYGRPGFIDVMNAVHAAWTEKRHQIENSAHSLASHVDARLGSTAAALALDPAALPTLAANLSDLIDPVNGGLKGAPKFPSAPFMQALWLDWLQSGDTTHRDGVIETQRKMLAGGIYDHVGGGLCRYSTDAKWIVPHFEKMLYDNAYLIRLSTWCHAATGDPLWQRRISETIAWLSREMTVAGGGFCSSLDADSEGEEGRYYVWTDQAVADVLGEADARHLLRTYRLEKPAAWEGNQILTRRGHAGLLSEEDEAHLRRLLDHLHQARQERVPPGRDDKVLVDWNGLAVSAIADAARVFDNEEWLDLAKAAYRFVTESSEHGRLPHAILGDRRHFPAISSDYAAMINAALSLYQATWDDSYLADARHWHDMLKTWHGDDAGTGFYLTASDSADVPMRIRGDVDDAVSSGTAQIIEALVRLAMAAGDPALQETATATAEAAMGRIAGQPYGQAGILYACGLALQPMKLVIRDPEPGPKSLVSAANRHPDPRRTDLLAADEAASFAALPIQETERISVREEKSPVEAAAWLCMGMTCLPPVSNPAALAEALERPPRAE